VGISIVVNFYLPSATTFFNYSTGRSSPLHQNDTSSGLHAENFRELSRYSARYYLYKTNTFYDPKENRSNVRPYGRKITGEKEFISAFFYPNDFILTTI
jgi:hypothetical protein